MTYSEVQYNPYTFIHNYVRTENHVQDAVHTAHTAIFSKIKNFFKSAKEMAGRLTDTSVYGAYDPMNYFMYL